MNKTLLDTDTFSEILKGKNLNVLKISGIYYAEFGYYTISVITVIEIIKGFQKVQREDQIQRFLTAVSFVDILTLNLQSAEIAGRIYADLERTGQPVGRADPMIAAIALENDLVLATGNTEHFQRIQKLGYPLKIDNWKIKIEDSLL